MCCIMVYLESTSESLYFVVVIVLTLEMAKLNIPLYGVR